MARSAGQFVKASGNAKVGNAMREWVGLLVVAGIAACGGEGSRSGPAPSAPQQLSRIEIVAPGDEVRVGEALQLTLRGWDAEGAAYLGEMTPRWTSGNPLVARVDAEGRVLAMGEGPVTIAAQVGGLVGSLRLQVLPARVAAARIEPTEVPLYVGESRRLLARAFDGQGKELLGRSVEWSSTAPEIVSIDEEGRALGLLPGRATIRVAVESAEGEVEAFVTLRPVASILIRDMETRLPVGQEVQLEAEVFADDGTLLEDRRVEWEVMPQELASLSPTGLLLPLTAGEARVLARAEGAESHLDLHFVEPVAEILLSPSSGELLVSEERELSVRLLDRKGRELSDRSVTWKSSHPEILIVQPDGRIQAKAAGEARIEATADEARASADFRILMLRFAQVEASEVGSCGLTNEGEVYCWGTLPNESGDSSHLAPSAELPRPMEQAVPFSRIAAGGTHLCTLSEEGQAHCVGSNGAGELGREGPGSTSFVPAAGDLRFESIYAGAKYSCGIEAGTGKAYCWGDNSTGQLGNGRTTGGFQATPVGGGHAFRSLALSKGMSLQGSGGTSTCGVERQSELAYCWGSNSMGLLGNGSQEDALEPVPVHGLTGIRSITFNGYRALGGSIGGSACAATGGGLLHCWGAVLAFPGYEEHREPVVFAEQALEYLAANRAHACGLRPDGRILCWGSNEYGEAGAGFAGGWVFEASPAVSVRSFEAISAGGFHTCALSDGVAWCWGRSDRGQAGRPDTGDLVLVAAPIPGQGVSSADAP